MFIVSYAYRAILSLQQFFHRSLLVVVSSLFKLSKIMDNVIAVTRNKSRNTRGLRIYILSISTMQSVNSCTSNRRELLWLVIDKISKVHREGDNMIGHY